MDYVNPSELIAEALRVAQRKSEIGVPGQPSSLS